jgi:SAM domain (Sterile alpha motif)
MGINDEASPPSAGPIVPSTVQIFNSQNAAGLLPWSTASSISHSHRYSISRAAFSTGSLPLLGTQSAALPNSGDHRCAHPACWTVQETVDWLRSKGFEDAVCQRFVEQEIAGDALLNLDVGKLKTEIGIAAYGKRVRIDSAIAECRRLAKVMSSSAIQPVSPLASQPTALERAPVRSASVGNLLRSRSPRDPSDLRRSPSVPIQRSTELAGDPGEPSADEKSDATMGLRLWVSSLLSSGGGQGGTAVSVQFRWGRVERFH